MATDLLLSEDQFVTESGRVVASPGGGGPPGLPMTGAEILAALAPVDGAGSGLDADKLDGLQASDFATATQGTIAEAAVPKALYNADSILVANLNDDPQPLTMGPSTILARLAAGSVVAATPAQLRALLDLEAGTDFYSMSAADLAFQAKDATLTSLAGQNWAVNAIPIGSGSDALSQVTFAANTFPARSSTGNLVAKSITDFALLLLTDATNTAMRSRLGLVLDTDIYAKSTMDTLLALKANLASPTFTGTVGLPADQILPGNPTTTTQAASDNSTRIATTAFVQVAAAAAASAAVANLNRVVSNDADVIVAENATLHELGISLTGDPVYKTLYDANTVLVATTDNTPAALTMANDTVLAKSGASAIGALAFPAQSILGRLGSGSLAATVAGDSTVLYKETTGDLGFGTFPQFRRALALKLQPGRTMMRREITQTQTATANRGYWARNMEGQSISATALTVYIGTSSGNICVAVYTSTGLGPLARPNFRKATSGSVASPGTGFQSIALTTFDIPGAAGGSVVDINPGDWLYVGADNGTVTFGKSDVPLVPALAGEAYQHDTSSFPAPATATSTPTATLVSMFVAGSS